MEVAEAGAGAKIMVKGGAEKEPEPKINNFGSATLPNNPEITLVLLCRNLLHSSSIEVSYFAAGIVAHLASDKPHHWTVSNIPKVG